MVFVLHRNGEKVEDLQRAGEKACKAVDMGGKIFHDLLRTALRNMFRASNQGQVAMTISGRKGRAVFDRCRSVGPDDLEKASQQMPNDHATVTNRVTFWGL